MGSLSGVCRWDILFWEVVRMIDDLLVRLMDDLSDVFAAIFAMDGFDFGNISEDFGNGGLGENISLVDLDHSSKRGEQIVKEWYKEINNYNYSKPGWKRGSLSVDLRSFQRETFNAHNNFRTLHGCPPLALSEELSGTAQAWADKLAERGFLQYSENPCLGENISLVDLDQSSKKGEQIVKEWYKEINNYNYSKPGWKRGAYRFSQLLWKSTTEIGVGVAKIPGQKNKAYVVANYRPAGNNNMPGEFERNVLPPQKLTANANLAGKNINRR